MNGPSPAPGPHGWLRAVLLVLAAVVLGAPGAGAEQVTIFPSQDNTLYEDPGPTGPMGTTSNGAGQYLFAGRTGPNAGGVLRRGLIAFDVARAIPAGSTIDAVALELFLSRSQIGDADVSLHRALAAWGEAGSDAGGNEGVGDTAQPGDATWLHTFFDTGFWAAPGGDFDPTPAATRTVGGALAIYSWSSPAMQSDVQSWLDAPAGNFGWVVLSETGGGRTAKRYDSREGVNPPALIVDFTPAAPVDACCFDDTSCGFASDALSCTSAGGIHQGVGSVCTPGLCVPPTGACCTAPAVCSEQAPADCTAPGDVYLGNGITCSPNACPTLLTPYVDPLAIPAVAEPVIGSAGGPAHYEIRMQRASHRFHSELPTTTVWAYEGTVPGPTIEARSDQTVTVNWIDDLREPNGQLLTQHDLAVDTCIHGAEVPEQVRTVVHLHGTHTFAEFDGHPELVAEPGDPGDLYVYPNGQLPAFLWYHDHALGITRLNVMMGLAGAYLIRDDFEDALGLPNGEFEIPLVIMDRRFRADGSLEYPSVWQEHFFGDKSVVNGVVWPFLDVKRGKYRLRILNASNSRHYTLSFEEVGVGPLPMSVIATDGGLLAVRLDGVAEITLGPAERAEVIVDFESLGAGSEVLLQNSAPAPFDGQPGATDLPEVMKFVVQDQPGFQAAIPSSLRPFTPIDPTGAPTRDFVLRKEMIADMCSVVRPHWLINGRPWTDPPVDPGDDPVRSEKPMLGTTEIWRFINASGITHPMHMHLVMFQVLDRRDVTLDPDDNVTSLGPPKPLSPTEGGWKDTVQVNPGEAVRVIATFTDYTGAVVGGSRKGFVYHCHILEHEDLEMMRQFDVVTVCGDGEKGPEEECDDGDTLSGDGCSPTCTWENTLSLAGLPQGGSVGVTVSGIALSVTTALGDSAAGVAGALAAAITADPTLAGLGVVAAAEGDRLVVSAPIDSSDLGDPGLGPSAVLTSALETFANLPIQTDAQGTDDASAKLFALRTIEAAVVGTIDGPFAVSSAVVPGGDDQVWRASASSGIAGIGGELVRAALPGTQDPAGVLSGAGTAGPFDLFFASPRDLYGGSLSASVRRLPAFASPSLRFHLVDAAGYEVHTPGVPLALTFEATTQRVPGAFSEGDTAQFDPGQVAGLRLSFESDALVAPALDFEVDWVRVPEPGGPLLGAAALALVGLLARRKDRAPARPTG